MTPDARAGARVNPLQLREEALAVRMLAAELEGEDLDLSIASETDFCEAVEALLGAIRDAETMRDAAKARAYDIAARADLFEERAQRLRDVLVGAMATAGRKTLALAEATVTVAEGASSAIITDPQSLPPELWRETVKRDPNMREITRRLKEGQQIPGATLNNAPPRLQIRMK